MSEEEDEIYCICRSTDVSRFMIGCDKCEEWYHGDCINVTEEDARSIKKFYCKFCRRKNPALEIKYKTKKVDSHNKHAKEKSKEEKLPKDSSKVKELKLNKHKEEKIKEHKIKDEKVKESKHQEHKKEEKHKDKHKDKNKDKIKESKFSMDKFSEKIKEKHKEDKVKDDRHKEHKIKDKHLDDKVREKIKEDKICDEKRSEKHKEKKRKEDKHKESKEKHDKNLSVPKSVAKPHTNLLKSSPVSKAANISNNERSSCFTKPEVFKDPIREAIRDVISKEKQREHTGNTLSMDILGRTSSISSLIKPTHGQITKAIGSTADNATSNLTDSKILKTTNNKSTSSTNKNLYIKTSSGTKPNNSNINMTLSDAQTSSKTPGHSVSSPLHKLLHSNISSKVSHQSQQQSSTSPDQSSSKSVMFNKRLSIDLSGSMVEGDRCGQCEACRVEHDCFNCQACLAGATCLKRRCKNMYGLKHKNKIPAVEHISKSQPVEQRSSTAQSRPSLVYTDEEDEENRPRSVLKDRNDKYSDDDTWEPTNKKVLQDRGDSKKKNKIKKKKVGAGGQGGSGGRKRKAHSEVFSGDSDGGEGVHGGGGAFGPKHQCQGPGCAQPARPHSKYCSQECGLKLAEKRIFAILPQRIQEWKLSGCVAESKDTKKLEGVRRQQLQAQAELQSLEAKCKELERIVERGLAETVDPAADEEMEEESGEGQGVYCVTCGHEVATRRAVKHMENCFNKIESQTTFGSHFKTRIEGNTMFCDFYSATTRTYCKRLRVMCPEHYKEPKVSETRVCGAPLTRDVFCETGALCRASRKRCLKHYRWERLRRAEIDMDRVRYWMKLDELLEQERQVRQSMTNRAGVLGLMLHSTYDHTIAIRYEEQLKLQQQQQEQQKQLQQQQQQLQHQSQQQLQQCQRQQQQQPPPPPQPPPQPQPKPTTAPVAAPQHQIKVVRKVQQVTSQVPLSGGGAKFRVIGQSQVGSSGSQVQVLHSDHRYFQSVGGKNFPSNRGGITATTTARQQHSDHQYYRPTSAVTPTGAPPPDGAIRLKVTQHKAVGGPPPVTPHKTVIHLQKSSGGPNISYLHQQQQQQQPPPPARLGATTITRYYQAGGSDTRYHQDHQYQRQPTQNPRLPAPQPPHSDHIYFTNKRPHK